MATRWLCNDLYNHHLVVKFSTKIWQYLLMGTKNTWHQHWEGDETLDWVLIYVAGIYLAQYCNICSSVSPRLMDPRGLMVTQTTYFSLLTHAKQLSLVTLCDTTARIGKNGSVTYIRTYGHMYVRTHVCTEGQMSEVWNSYLDFCKIINKETFP